MKPFKIDEDYNAQDQILQRVNEEANWNWAKHSSPAETPKVETKHEVKPLSVITLLKQFLV